MRSRMRAVGVAVLCVAALAGCSHTVVASDGGGGFHLAQIDGRRPTQTRSIRVDHVSTPPGSSFEWTVASVDPASRQLQLHYLDGACTSADRVAVDETATTVVIGITASKTFQGNCIAVGIPRTAAITLRKPLGGRALMEQTTGVNDGLTKVADPTTLPSPICSTGYGTGADVPVGMLDAVSRIAPTTTVSKVFVCRTWWPKGSAHTESKTITDHSKVASLTRAIDAGTKAVRAGAPDSRCSTKESSASWYSITLEGPGVRVEVRTDAIFCDTITNGAASGTMTPALVRTLDALFVS